MLRRRASLSLRRTGTPQSVQAAINQGADVNAMNKDGMTPLMAAAFGNSNSDVITTLVKAGAYVDARDEDGETALMYAASSGTPR